MQILHPFAGSIQQYGEVISDPDRYRPNHCPQCEAQQPLAGHGFYQRTLVDVAFDGVIRVRRYLCRLCKRTVSLLPEFALPWLRFSLTVISLFLVARLLQGLTLAAAALAASQKAMPYQRGQFWIRRFRKQAEPLVRGAGGVDCAPVPASNFVARALTMLESIGWIAAHRFLFADLRIPPAGLAGVSRSRRSGSRAPPGGAAGLRVPTQLLSGAGAPSALCFWPRRSSRWMPRPKKSPSSGTG